MVAESGSRAIDNRSHRILLCDDSPLERHALALQLRAFGYAVEEVDGGKAALDFIKSHEMDLLLLDLHMPGVDGFDVLRYLQEHRRNLPVVLLTGLPPDLIQPGVRRLLKRELPPMLLKPVDQEQLLQIVEMELSGQMPDLDTAPPTSAPPSS